jgi:polar amino acid transport system substrate-binding protein
MLKFSKIALTIFVFFVMFVVYSCNNAKNTETNNNVDKLNNIIANKEMKVGYLIFNPCVIKDPKTGEMSGIFVDMVNQIAASLKVKVTWVETNLANFTTGLKSNQFDFCVGPTFITPSRASTVLFSQPISYFGNSGVVMKNGKFKPKTEIDLNSEGKRIAVLQGQVMEDYCKKNFPKAKIVSLSGSDLTSPLVAVSSGNADIGLMNNVLVLKYSKEHSEVTPVLLDENQMEILPLSWTTTFEDRKLMDFLNSSITYLKSTGRLTKYQKKHETQLFYDLPNLKKVQ